jgi:transposase InsO family protein
VFEQNLSVYGADKIWDQLNKDGIRVARCTVERLMRDMGLQGGRRGRTWVRTTTGDDRLERPADLVERQFRAPAPNRLWVADLERHEALPNRAVVKGHRLLLVAASGLKLRAA